MDTFRNPLDSDRREELLEFADRYERGAPYDDISEEEAVDRYREVVSELSGEDYRHSAREAFSRMEQEERAEPGKQLRNQSLRQGYAFTEPAPTMASSPPGPRLPNGVGGTHPLRASGPAGGSDRRRRRRPCGRYLSLV